MKANTENSMNMDQLVSNLRRAIIAVTLVTAAFSFNAKAQVIIQDNFNQADHTVNATKAPIDAPDQYYFTADNYGTSPVSVTGNELKMDANNTVLVSIASNGTYVKPSAFNVSIDFKMGQLGEMELGFGPTGSIGSVDTYPFEGLNLGSNGDLSLQINGTDTLISHFNSGVFGGAFNVNSFYTLSYNVDTTSGDISRIMLVQGTKSVMYDVNTSLFTDADTNYLFINSAGATVGLFGYADNLDLGPPVVPEPSTWAMLLLGLGGLAIAVRRRQLR